MQHNERMHMKVEEKKNSNTRVINIDMCAIKIIKGYTCTTYKRIVTYSAVWNFFFFFFIRTQFIIYV